MLHEPSKKRIEEGGINGKGLWNLFEEMAKGASNIGVEGLDTIVTFTEEDDEFILGSYLPEIHLIVRRIDDIA